MQADIRLYGIRLPLVKEGDDLARLIVNSFGNVEEGDVLVVTSKVISKAKGYLIDVENVRPSKTAKVISFISGKPAWFVELCLNNSKGIFACIPIYELLSKPEVLRIIAEDEDGALEVLRKDRAMLVMEMADGRLASDSGIDLSNLPAGIAAYPPPNPDEEAKEIRERIRELTGVDVAVIVTDTEFSLTRFGSVDIAIGCSGIRPVESKFGSRDLYGKRKFGGVDMIADELAAAAALLMRQTDEGVPVVLIRGVRYERGEIGISRTNIPRNVLGRGLLRSLLCTLAIRFFALFRRG